MSAVHFFVLVLLQLLWRGSAWKVFFARQCTTFGGLLLACGLSSVEMPANAATYNAAVAQTYDILDGGGAAEVLGLNKLRRDAGAKVKGSVLEVAVGTGLQSSYYDVDAMTSYTAVDSSPSMLVEARSKWSNSPRLAALNPKLLEMDAAHLDLPSASFDSVIDTFSFCTFREPELVAREMIRVLKPGGVLVLLENSVSTNPALKLVQDITEPIVTPLSKSCRWNVNVPSIIEKVGGVQLVAVDDEQLGTITLRVYNKANEATGRR